MIPERIITKLGKARFKVLTTGLKDGQLILNFNPLIEKFKLTGNYQLIHWQARPKDYREWGIYNSFDDSYTSISGFTMQGTFESLQIPDEQAGSIPTAVILLRK
jgi:hypothetical protein